MPEYTYKCRDCETTFARTLPIKDRDAPQHCDCGTEASKVIPDGVGGVLRGDGWPGKGMRLKAQMAARRARVDRRQEQLRRETNVGGRLVPNVGGERVDSWDEARKLAKSQGRDTAAYDRMAQQEGAT